MLNLELAGRKKRPQRGFVAAVKEDMQSAAVIDDARASVR